MTITLTPAQHRALVALAGASGPIRPTAEFRRHTLGALVERGLAQRTDVQFHSAVDRPAYAITEKGRTLLRALLGPGLRRKITDEQIRALGDEAAAAGDWDLVQACNVANMDAESLAEAYNTSLRSAGAMRAEAREKAEQSIRNRAHASARPAEEKP